MQDAVDSGKGREDEEDYSDRNTGASNAEHTTEAQATYTKSRNNMPPFKRKGETQSHQRQQEKQSNSNTDETSLRELRKKAYSRSSLHTYKADPLKRRKSTGTPSDSRGGSRRGGKGQPNMKLRMEAMLEQIKRGTT